ncbi:sporulation protein [Haloglycomyces albus]|uniref:sporulation protein n=1 Tax=Haloglycomyces albus TaxID=526067 RepID=UPI00046CBBB7|nr:sporulation protein [Haloglycomyces albus]
MVFDKFKQAFGAGVSIDTVLSPEGVKPGETLKGEVHFSGGDVEQNVNGINLAYTAVVTSEDDGKEKSDEVDFFTAGVTGPFDMDAGSEHTVEFESQVPWEAPISTIAGRPMAGMKLGIATELDLKFALDKGDMDELSIDPLPIQEAVMEAIEELGFIYQESDLEPGTIEGSHMAFYQEIIFWANGDYAEKFRRLELTFVAGREETDVILQIDNSSDLVNPDHNSFIRFTLPTDDTEGVADAVAENLESLVQRKNL